METTIFEDVHYALEVVLSRCKLIAMVLAMAIPVGLLTLPFMTPQYEAVALLNLQEGELSDPLKYEKREVSRSKMEDKYMVLMRWLTSEHVLSGYLDEINKGQTPLSATQRTDKIKAIRRSVSIEPLGGTALEIKLRGDEAKGLGGKLEILISVFLERLVGPNRQVLGAKQFLLNKYKERVIETKRTYETALKNFGHKSVYLLRVQLDRLSLMEKQLARISSSDKAVLVGGKKRKVELLRQKISRLSDEIMQGPLQKGAPMSTLEVLKRKNDRLKMARQQLKIFSSEYRVTGNSNFFDLDRLTLLGRPMDPVYGKSKKLKMAILICIAFAGLAGGLVLLFEYLEQRIRRSKEFSHLGGVPIIARFPR
ncbi:MAG: hypothetical protein L3J67_05015 [Hyphomicrobiaceae bacterium]|nr:hypothetical protein [Hyphomicrobiaceae bacterium]